MYQIHGNKFNRNINENMASYMSNIQNNTKIFSESLEATKIEVLKIKNYLNNLSDTNQIDSSEQFSTKSEIINEIIQSNDKKNNLNSDTEIKSNESLNETQKIKDILDYIIAIDKEIEKNRNTKLVS